MDQDIELLKLITAPYAYSSAHVQGPGGNTSVKIGDKILIKASGFTFANVADDAGVVGLYNAPIIENLKSKLHLSGKIFENAAPAVVFSQPEGLKPSMEFEFHSILKTFVLHTHSVYANVITCAAECKDLLAKVLPGIDYALVPYVTPGFPIAASLMEQYPDQNVPKVIFLKNHGIIVHADDAEVVVATYNKVQSLITQYFDLPDMHNLVLEKTADATYIINKENLEASNIQLHTFEGVLLKQVLIPDQSIFFKDKVSGVKQSEPGLFVDFNSGRVIIKGSEKFIEAAKEMTEAVYYISNNIAKLGLTPDYITAELIDIMHGLSTEKHRAAILKN